MTDHKIVAVFDSVAQADAAIRDLESAGLPRDAIETHAAPAIQAEPETVRTEPSQGGGFFAWLFGEDTPEQDQAVYRDSLDRGGMVVSVMAAENDHGEIVAILERNGPVDVDERSQTLGYAPSGAVGSGAADRPDAGYAETGIAAPTMPGAVDEQPMPTPYPDARRRETGNGEEKLQLAEEKLDVGKRTVQGGRVRIRTRVVETPVSEDVALRDEHVSVERRPAAGSTTPGADAFTEKAVELSETREEPVVSKTARVVEEVALGKDVRERTPRVGDTVRREEADIERVDEDGKARRDPQPADRRRPV
jgi:uncharacterized protein (TIGR02271 family)